MTGVQPQPLCVLIVLVSRARGAAPRLSAEPGREQLGSVIVNIETVNTGAMPSPSYNISPSQVFEC